MFALVAVHDDSALGLELPCTLVHVEHDYVHAEVQRRLLRAEPGAQAVVEEHHEQGLVPSELLVGEGMLLHVSGGLHRVVKAAKLLY